MFDTLENTSPHVRRSSCPSFLSPRRVDREKACSSIHSGFRVSPSSGGGKIRKCRPSQTQSTGFLYLGIDWSVGTICSSGVWISPLTVHAAHSVAAIPRISLAKSPILLVNRCRAPRCNCDHTISLHQKAHFHFHTLFTIPFLHL